MEIDLYQVDAFASEHFGGNPAAVMPLERWLDDALLQAIAAENNLSETAFYVPAGEGFELRWFTPTVEVDLCGHATLAAAHVLFNHRQYASDILRFQTRSGELMVSRGPGGLTLDFPAVELAPLAVDPEICVALGTAALSAVGPAVPGSMVVYVFSSEAEVAALQPDFPALCEASPVSVIATAAGDECDFVSRFFGPQVGLDEDPVTGSAHCLLVPYWAGMLDKSVLRARQISARGGELECELAGDRVAMTGTAVTYLSGRTEPLDC